MGSPAALLARATLPLLRRLPAETAHGLGLKGLSWLSLPRPMVPAALARSFMGLKFAHPLGLAAGFDKNGDYADALGQLGFSHIEFGTVTPRAQDGNPRPRMFRRRAECALINRMGFNNRGVDHLVARLRQSQYGGVRGISIGKNADTPLERAHEDYLACFSKVYAEAHYVAVNVSSPNTRGLRELQASAWLTRLLEPLLETRERLATGTRRVPLLVKLAPDLADADLDDIAATLVALRVDGIIATNTTIRHELLRHPPQPAIQGGLSGAPLHARSLQVIARLRATLGPHVPLIGVGGVVDAAGACRMLAAGADLIQVYTGFAYRGIPLIEEILQALA